MNAPNHENRVAGPRLVAIVGPVSERQDQPSRGDPGARRRRGAARLGARRHQRRRFEFGGAQPRDERRAQCRQHRLSRRPVHLLRFSRLDRIHPRHALRAAGLRRRSRRMRGRSAQGPGASGHPSRARGARVAAHPVSQQDRSGERGLARDAGDAPAGLAHAAAAAPDSGLGERRRHRICRPRARARLRLSRGRAVQRHRDAGGRASRRKSRRAISCSRSSPTTTTR